ncbi:MAG: YitT family protein [Melioribacteraceae bacterium]|nr:YitT family protein [Melioribacteraceae bacterium]
MKKLFNKTEFKEYLAIAIGAIIMALGIGVFLVDAKVVPGGISGIGMAIYYLTDETIPIGLTVWLFNVPLYIWGVKVLGKRFGIRTFYGFSVNAFFIDFFRGDIPGFGFIRLQDSQTVQNLLEHDFLFLILIGAALLGVGLGIVFKYKGTTGGIDIIVAILHKKYQIKQGMAILILDVIVIAIAGIAIEYKSMPMDKPTMLLVLYALFLGIVSVRIIDLIIDGFDYARQAYIVSDKNDEIAKKIMSDLSRGATAIKTRGLYKDIDREMITTIVTLKELGKLTDIIKEIDPDAFVVIHNVHEVLGEGFRRRT